MSWLVVRVRGSVNVRGTIADTMAMLRLHKTNHCTLIPETPSYRGMLSKVKDYVTWGEVEPETMTRLLEQQGRMPGDNFVDDNLVNDNTTYKSVNDLAHAMATGEATFTDLPGLKPVFRLHPPRGGYEGIKRSFVNGGALGYRKEAINKLVGRMR